MQSKDSSRLFLAVRGVNARIALFCILAIFVISVAISAPLLTAHSPTKVQLHMRLKPPGSKFPDGTRAILGTDALGRDVFTRILYGARPSLLIAVTSVGAAMLVGVTVGLYSGYYGRKLDTIVMRIVDVQLSFPSILLAVMVVSVLGASILSLVIALGLSRWVVFARIARGAALETKEQEYVTAAKAIGTRDFRIIYKDILSNVISSVLIIGTLEIGRIVLAESALSFLGLGIQPPTPSWGGMVSDGREYLATAWWGSTFPGLALSFTVLVIGLLGDSIRDRLDPYMRVI